MTGDRDSMTASDETETKFQHQPYTTATARLAADVIVKERDVHLGEKGVAAQGNPAGLQAKRAASADTIDGIPKALDSDHPIERGPEGKQPDLLDQTPAGSSVIRGGALRLGAHVVGALASVAASAVVIRHLGVIDTGRFITVMSLVVIAGSISDLGMSAVGVRDYAVRPLDERHRLLRNLLGMRLAFLVVGVTLATIFAAAAGYTDAMVLGTVIAGVAMALLVTQQSLAILFHVRLRFGTVAGLALFVQIGVAITAALLAMAGAGLSAFFAVQVPAMVFVLALAVMLGGRDMRALPAFDRLEWRRMLRQILPYSAAVILSVLYLRIAQIMVSLLSTGDETGFFGVPFRVLETLIAIPPLLASTALPILARTARHDADRFASAGRRLAESMLIAGTGLTIVVFLSAEFCIDLVAGPGFERSVGVLRILAFALVGTFIIAARGYSLLALGSMRAILISNALALGIVFVVGVPLVHAHGAVGAALTLLAAELALAASYELAITRSRALLRLSPSFVARVTCAAALATLPVLLIHLPSLVGAAIAAVIYSILLVTLGIVPAELRQTLWQRRPPSMGAV